MKTLELLRKAVEGKLDRGEEGLGYVHPSTLAQGCLLAAGHELLRHPRAEPEARRRRIMQAGTLSHERIMGYLRPFIVARELPFLEPELRIKGRCDALLYIPPEAGVEEPGFYALEVKTTSSVGFAEVRGQGAPKPEHLRQCLLYQRGLRNFYGVPVRGGIVYYENRDTLEYQLFAVEYDEGELAGILEKLPRVISLAREGKLPEGEEYRLPADHWAHRYCPYLPLCPYGQEAVANAKREIPPAVKARIIAERIVRKELKDPRKGRHRPRSLEELAREFGWE